MEKFIKNSLVLGMLSCPVVFFVNPPFWIQLLMSEPSLDPLVKRVAGQVGDGLEWCIGDNEIGTASAFGSHVMKLAINNKPATEERTLLAA